MMKRSKPERSRRSQARRGRLGLEVLEPRVVLSTIVGTLQQDFNDDGRGDAPLSNAEVFLDLNGNGFRDAFTITRSTDASQRISAGQAAVSPLLVEVPGGASITRVVVRLNVDADRGAGEFWYGDQEISVTAPGVADANRNPIALAAYMSGDLDLTFDDTDPTASDGLTRAKTPVLGAPAGGVWQGTYKTRYFGDHTPRNLSTDLAGSDPSGTWTLSLRLNRSDATLVSWSVTITALEPIATTDSQGRYELRSVGPGTYRVLPVLGPTSRMTTNPNPVVVSANSPAIVDGPTLAVHRQRVLEDTDGDGRGDRSALSGLPVFVDLDGDGLLDKGEPLAATDIHGRYDFRGVEPGTYTILVDPGATWEQVNRPVVTIPADRSHVAVPDLVYRRRTTFDVTPAEQYYLEQVNRLRRDPRGFLLGEVRGTQTYKTFFPDEAADDRYEREIATLRAGALPPIAWDPRLRNLSDEMAVMMRDLKSRRHTIFDEFFPARYSLDNPNDMAFLRGGNVDDPSVLGQYIARLSQAGIVPTVRQVAVGTSSEYGRFTFVATHPEFRGGYDEASRTLTGIVGPGSTEQEARERFYRELSRWASALADPNGLAPGHNVPDGRYGDAYSDRVGRARYGAGEGNSLSKSPYDAFIDLLVDGGSPGSPLDPNDPSVRSILAPGHRAPYVDPRIREIGIGMVANTSERLAGKPEGPFDPARANPVYFSGNYATGSPDRAYVLGVAYTDTDRDGLYDIGEQRAGIDVTLDVFQIDSFAGLTYKGRQSMKTWSGGGYQFSVQWPIGPFALFVQATFQDTGTTRSGIMFLDSTSGRLENLKLDDAQMPSVVKSPSTSLELDAVYQALARAESKILDSFGAATVGGGAGMVRSVDLTLRQLNREIGAGLASDPQLSRAVGPVLRGHVLGPNAGSLRRTLLPAARAFSTSGTGPVGELRREVLSQRARDALVAARAGIGAATGLYYHLTVDSGADRSGSIDPRALRQFGRQLSAEFDTRARAVWQSVWTGMGRSGAAPVGIQRTLNAHIDLLKLRSERTLAGVPGFSENLRFYLDEPVFDSLSRSWRGWVGTIPDANPHTGRPSQVARSLYAEHARLGVQMFRSHVLGLLTVAGELLGPPPGTRR